VSARHVVAVQLLYVCVRKWLLYRHHTAYCKAYSVLNQCRLIHALTSNRIHTTRTPQLL